MSVDNITVVIADDQELIRAGLRVLLDRTADLTVVGEASHGREAVSLVRTLCPQVVLMDVRMPFLNGIEATRLIRDDVDCAGTAVIVLTTFDSDANLFSALAAGTAGFLTKDAGPQALREGVRTVASGQALLDPAVTTRVVERAVRRHTPDAAAAAAVSALTDREDRLL